MPNPREAIFDVLKSKKERAKEQAEIQHLWDEYQNRNAVALGKETRRDEQPNK